MCILTIYKFLTQSECMNERGELEEGKNPFETIYKVIRGQRVFAAKPRNHSEAWEAWMVEHNALMNWCGLSVSRLPTSHF